MDGLHAFSCNVRDRETISRIELTTARPLRLPLRDSRLWLCRSFGLRSGSWLRLGCRLRDLERRERVKQSVVALVAERHAVVRPAPVLVEERGCGALANHPLIQ